MKVLLLLTLLSVTVNSVTVKVANTMGRGTTMIATCFNGNKELKTKNNIGNGDDLTVQYSNKCSNNIICGGVISKTGQFFSINVCKGCSCKNTGYFLRLGSKPGVYKGTLTGGNLQFSSKFTP